MSPGFLLIDKPAGITSFAVIARLRHLTGIKRIGHAGTLDPFATGLLIVGVGREATREMERIIGMDKRYEAEFAFGATSTTDDVTGELSEPVPVSFTESQLRDAIKPFTGSIQQVPPTYAAIKVQGKKLYELARAGTPTLVKARPVHIYGFHLDELSDSTHAKVRIHCSSGTYIRSLARDLGAALGVGGYVTSLRRTSIGTLTVQEALPLTTLTLTDIERHILPVDDFFTRLT